MTSFNFDPYPALWRCMNRDQGTEYVPITVLSAPVFGHVSCAIPAMALVLSERFAAVQKLPLSEIVGVE